MVKWDERDVFRERVEVEGALILAERGGGLGGSGSSLIGLTAEKEGREMSDGECWSTSLRSGLEATEGILRCSRHSLPSMSVSTLRGVVAGKRLARSFARRRRRVCSRVSKASVRRSSSDCVDEMDCWMSFAASCFFGGGSMRRGGKSECLLRNSRGNRLRLLGVLVGCVSLGVGQGLLGSVPKCKNTRQK
jgi:hypothetical protein